MEHFLTEPQLTKVRAALSEPFNDSPVEYDYVANQVRGVTPETRPRARQNVILELGYFIGRLGRGKVCALKRGTLEMPTDYAGVVYESMEGNWKHALGRELQEAGYYIDWNKVMKS
ncbi:hypothetical protein FCH79_08135 [Pseudomonas koreensis]|uniref:TIR domain-containing protein n=1 Tax=Pseudomonas TaxID=286 RepID=UPI000A36FEAA|nr:MULTISPECIES: TIR domain-containing protein [Pseudomonas]NTZ95291.1 hypothetical protein [Pseudomonas koreensis]